MAWPGYDAYREALQNPQLHFKEPELRQGKVAVNKMGLPLISSGNYGCVFKVQVGPAAAKGVKCFTCFSANRQRRYSAISAYLAQHPLRPVIEFKYREGEILVTGKRYPVLVMEWVQGHSLDRRVDSIVHGSGDRIELAEIADAFAAVIGDLEDAGVAHGDLQHGNIIVTANDELKLVDLDGMFVPTLAGLETEEYGLPEYQHPKRDAQMFGPALDRFSAIVIYLSLMALRDKPELWAKFHPGTEGLIFKRADFLDPSRSELFRQLKAMKGPLGKLAETLEKACGATPLQAPALKEIVRSQPRPKRPKIAVLDAAGSELKEIVLAAARDAAGAPVTQRAAFFVENRGGAEAKLQISSSDSWVRNAGPTALALKPGAKSAVRLEVTLPERPPKAEAELTIATPWFAKGWSFARTIPLKFVALRLAYPTGGELRGLHCTVRRSGLRDRSGRVGFALHNEGSVAAEIRLSASEHWLALSGEASFQQQPGEHRDIEIEAYFATRQPETRTGELRVKAVAASDGRTAVELSLPVTASYKARWWENRWLQALAALLVAAAFVAPFLQKQPQLPPELTPATLPPPSFRMVAPPPNCGAPPEDALVFAASGSHPELGRLVGVLPQGGCTYIVEDANGARRAYHASDILVGEME